MVMVYVSIGSNIDRERNIRSAVAALKYRFGRITLSSVYETQAQGFAGDPFYNLVAGFETPLNPKEINAVLRAIENQHGRQRGGPKFSARTLDLDLLLYGQAIIEEYNVPRDEITRYAFVLLPLAEIAPDVIHPCLQKPLAVLWQDFEAAHHPSSDSVRSVELSL